MRPPDPAAPKSLADPEALAARRAMRHDPHVAPLRAMAARIAADFGASVPDPDPLDGGVGARLLLLLETPGPAIVRTGLVSRDNPTGTAANLFRFLAEARIARGDTLIWNAVPWVIHAAGAPNRAPRRSEIQAAAPCLGPLLALLPDLAVVMLAGRVAGDHRRSSARPACPRDPASKPDLRLYRAGRHAPHPGRARPGRRHPADTSRDENQPPRARMRSCRHGRWPWSADGPTCGATGNGPKHPASNPRPARRPGGIPGGGGRRSE